jgi:hypothetical protein
MSCPWTWHPIFQTLESRKYPIAPFVPFRRIEEALMGLGLHLFILIWSFWFGLLLVLRMANCIGRHKVEGTTAMGLPLPVHS